MRRHDAGQEEEARLSFSEAYTVLHTPNILFNLARSEQLTGRFLEALGHYKQYANDADPRISSTDRDTARKHIAELTGKVGHVAVDAPAHAHVTVDGTQMPGETPFTEALDVSVGKHMVQARVGDVAKSMMVETAAGQTAPAKFEFDPATSATAVAAVPVVTTVPATPTTPQPAPADTGTRTSPGFFTPKHVTVIALAGGAVVATVLGVAFAVQAGSAQSQIDSDHQQIQSMGGNPTTFCGANPNTAPCPDLASSASSHSTDVGLEAGFFVAGGVLAVGALAALLLWPETPSTATSTRAFLRPEPLMMRGGGGLGFVGSF